MQKIILLHGALGCAADMNALAVMLSRDKNFETHVFSFSGHGEADLQARFGIEQFSEELEIYITRNDLTGCLVFGYSMGGYVALYLAAKKENLMKGVITLGTKFNWTKESIQNEAGNCDEIFLSEKAPAFLQLLKEKHRHLKDLLKKTKEMIIHFEENILLSDQILKKISTPVLLGSGDKDKMVPITETIAVQEQLPRASVFVLPDTKHPLEKVDLDLLSFLIRSFNEKIKS